jgi:hypothetical protein
MDMPINAIVLLKRLKSKKKEQGRRKFLIFTTENVEMQMKWITLKKLNQL